LVDAYAACTSLVRPAAGRQGLLSRNIAQHVTSNRLATATIAAFRRCLLPLLTVWKIFQN
jgi:hypothetical protein